MAAVTPAAGAESSSSGAALSSRSLLLLLAPGVYLCAAQGSSPLQQQLLHEYEAHFSAFFAEQAHSLGTRTWPATPRSLRCSWW